MIHVIKGFTTKQLLLAAGLGRNLSRSELCRVVGISDAYISKEIRIDAFNNLILVFKNRDLDDDVKKYTGLGTLFMMVGRYLYSIGEKENVERE